MNTNQLTPKSIKIFCLVLYYFIFRYFPSSGSRFFGKISKRLRYACCKRVFHKCGKNVNIERLASFGNGFLIEIGDNSGLGVNCDVPNNIIIGNDVKMGPNVVIIPLNHEFISADKTIHEQGYKEPQLTIIEDDVWIGRSVICTPGRKIKKGTVVAAGTVLCKDFEEYSVVGGNPSRMIKKRLKNEK